LTAGQAEGRREEECVGAEGYARMLDQAIDRLCEPQG
jgi:hypothetical protein